MGVDGMRPRWEWFAAAIGLLLLLLCGLDRSVIAFAVGCALLTAGLIAGLLGPHLAREASRPDDHAAVPVDETTPRHG